jgi:hypothetical protein
MNNKSWLDDIGQATTSDDRMNRMRRKLICELYQQIPPFSSGEMTQRSVSCLVEQQTDSHRITTDTIFLKTPDLIIITF